MCELVINGGTRLFGELCVQGSKNAVLPILAATILTDEECVIHNCPNISDVHTAIDILSELGVRAKYEMGKVSVCAANIDGSVIRKELMQKMRSSVMFMGPILARRGESVICLPGGCLLGERPIDMHIKSLSRLGAKILDMGDCIYCKLTETIDGDVTLLYPSVGATENIMLMCASSGREVRIYNPAREPEIVALQNFLNLMGADIRGAGTDLIRICKAGEMHGCEYTVIPDRIAVATYACATAACGGDVYISDVEAQHCRTVIEALSETGCEIQTEEKGLRVKSAERLKPINLLKTLPYPGFPTDVQPLFGAILSKADGVSKINETVFDSRFNYLYELKKMGADITEGASTAEIRGVTEMYGAEVTARDLRGGAALVIAGLMAKGTTVVSGVDYIDRGYEKIEDVFKVLGADIIRI